VKRSGRRAWRLPGSFGLVAVAVLAGCGSGDHVSSGVRACVKRWNGSLVKRHTLDGIAFGTEANVRVEAGRCVVILMGARERVLTFDSGHPGGIGSFLFAGALDKKDLPPARRKPNADVGPHFVLSLK
jgi:hypothetical protein